MKISELLTELQCFGPNREVFVSLADGQRGGDYTMQESSGRLSVTSTPDGGPVFIHLGTLSQPRSR